MKKLILRIMFFSGALMLFSTSTAVALTPEQKRVMLGGSLYFNTSATVFCETGSASGRAPTTNIAQGGTIYVLGDSITVGMRDHGQLGEKLTEAGWEPTEINAVGGEDLVWGAEQLTNDASILANSESLLVGLGTNNIGNVVNNDGTGAIEGGGATIERMMTDIVSAAKAANPDITIYWTSIYITGTLSTSYGDFDMDVAMPIINGALANVATQNGISIVPYGTSPEAVELTSSDGIHPSGRYPEMATYIAAQVGTNPVGSPPAGGSTSCSCGTGGGGGTSPIAGSPDRDTRYRETWAYFLGKDLSPEVIAGVMGNLEAESGIDPHNTQNNAPAPDGPEIPIDAIRNRFGYGIAQWTSSGRQDNLIAYAQETGRSTGDLGLQLDFLWKELTESYPGVMAELTVPNQTLAQASYIFLSEFEIPAPFAHGDTQGQIEETAHREELGNAIYAEFSGQGIAPGAGGGGCSSAGTNYDLVSEDTTNIPCGSGTEDAGEADGYRDGQLIRIRLCRVGGTLVNSQAAGSVARMLADSAAAGVGLGMDGGGGSFRDMQGQIDTYLRWCESGGITPTPAPYPKAAWSDYTRCPGAAPPGYSNHQAGFALDLTCDGQLIPQSHASAQSNECYQWLVQNAQRYGFYEFGRGQDRNASGYEAWHWSVDGS